MAAAYVAHRWGDPKGPFRDGAPCSRSGFPQAFRECSTQSVCTYRKQRLAVCKNHIINVKSMVLYKGASIQRRISKQSYLYIPCRFSFRFKRWPLGTMINPT